MSPPGSHQHRIKRASQLSRNVAVDLQSHSVPRQSGEDPVCTPADGETQPCCRRSLWISFRELGWDSWIIRPHGYQAYFCDGSCPPGHLPAHNYAAVRQLLLAGAVAPGQSPAPPIPAPHCSATRLGPLPLVHYLHGRQVVSVFEDMVVEQCRCV